MQDAIFISNLIVDKKSGFQIPCKMKQILTILLLYFTPLIYAKSDGIVVPLIRQKSPREVSVNLKKIKGFPTNWNWLKPNPGPTNDSVALYRYLDNEFYAVIQIGKKARPYNMVLDTAWGHSWIMSEDCSYRTVGCWFHNKYDHTKSSSYIENGTSYNMQIGKYNMSGYFSQDTFHLEQLYVTNQTFVEMVHVPWYYILSKADGVLGLGYSSLASGVPPVFYNLIKQGRIKKALFSVYLNRDKSSNRGGNVILGRIEQRHILHNQSITYLPVNQTGYWQFKMDRIVLDDYKKTYSFCTFGCQAIVDTSSNSILGPKTEIAKINRLIKAKYIVLNRYQINCDTINKLPDISFIIAGKNFTLQGRDYVQQLSYRSFTLCLSAFMETTSNQNEWFLGGAFLSEFYSIYNLEDNQIGFVKAA